jgi:hypothetical protein
MTEWQITIDCADPSRLVRFWGPVLGYEVRPPPEGFESWNDWYLSVGVPEDELDLTGDGADRLQDPTGRGPNIWFQVVPEEKAGKNRLHFDVYVGGGRTVPIAERRSRVDSRVAELIESGATIDHVADHAEENDHYFVVMHDPEGNEFCVA